jgi:hypothetical protein
MRAVTLHSGKRPSAEYASFPVFRICRNLSTFSHSRLSVRWLSFRCTPKRVTLHSDHHPYAEYDVSRIR